MKEVLKESVARGLERVRAQIGEACHRAGRAEQDVRLVAVTKRQSLEAVRAALDAGQRDFGENYLQEAREKILAMRDSPARWHMIGGLQSNKAKEAVSLFDVVEGLDSLSTARRLAAAAVAIDRVQSAFVQIKLGGGEGRSGLAPEEAANFVEQVAALEGLRIDGVMAVAPAGEPPRPHFARLQELTGSLRGLRLENAPLLEISAGMSADFREAIAEGATLVRIGSAIFGERDS